MAIKLEQEQMQPSIPKITFFSPALRQSRFAEQFYEIAPWLDSEVVQQAAPRRGWTSEQAISEQLNNIELWCKKLANEVKIGTTQLGWIHDMIGKTGLIRKVSYRNAREWMVTGMSIDAHLLTFAINQYSACQAIERYDIPIELLQQAQPIQLAHANQIIDEYHKQYDDIVRHKTGNRPIDELPFEEAEQLYKDVDLENREKVRRAIIEALQGEPEATHEIVAQHGGQLDKPCFFISRIDFNPETMTLEARMTCNLNPNQIQAMRHGKYAICFQDNESSMSIQQYGQKLYHLIQD